MNHIRNDVTKQIGHYSVGILYVGHCDEQVFMMMNRK